MVQCNKNLCPYVLRFLTSNAMQRPCSVLNCVGFLCLSCFISFQKGFSSCARWACLASSSEMFDFTTKRNLMSLVLRIEPKASFHLPSGRILFKASRSPTWFLEWWIVWVLWEYHYHYFLARSFQGPGSVGLALWTLPWWTSWNSGTSCESKSYFLLPEEKVGSYFLLLRGRKYNFC